MHHGPSSCSLPTHFFLSRFALLPSPVRHQSACQPVSQCRLQARVALSPRIGARGLRKLSGWILSEALTGWILAPWIRRGWVNSKIDWVDFLPPRIISEALPRWILKPRLKKEPFGFYSDRFRQKAASRVCPPDSQSRSRRISHYVGRRGRPHPLVLVGPKVAPSGRVLTLTHC